MEYNLLLKYLTYRGYEKITILDFKKKENSISVKFKARSIEDYQWLHITSMDLILYLSYK